MANLTALDILVLTLVGGSAVLGFMRGLVQEVTSLLAWILAIVAVRFFHGAATDLMAGMDPDICFSMSSDFAAAGSAADADHAAGGSAQCQHDCVCLHLNLLAPPMTVIGLPAAARQFEHLTLAMDAPVSAAWPSGQPRGPPRP